MAKPNYTFDVYLEAGQKKVIAGAIEWPGWTRIGKDETSALQALVDYGPRYAAAMKLGKVEFTAPDSLDALSVVERLKGGPATDFGVPDLAPDADMRPLDEAGLVRLQGIIEACWRALDKAARAAEGKELRKGPRGGGREVEDILRHVMESEGGHLSRLVLKVSPIKDESPAEYQARVRPLVLNRLADAAHGEVPAQGPRGGKVWSGRYFARRVGWHILDHAWEIEDRLMDN